MSQIKVLDEVVVLKHLRHLLTSLVAQVIIAQVKFLEVGDATLLLEELGQKLCVLDSSAT